MKRKQCVQCKRLKHVTEFHARSRAKDGLAYYCKTCTKDRTAKYLANPDVVVANRARAKRWREKNPEKAKATHDSWVKRNRRHYLFSAGMRHRKHRYGVTRAVYDAMVIASGGHCAICDRITPDLVIDHCHHTDNVREMLCMNCNAGMGNLNDDPVLIRKVLAYLEKHNEDR